MTKYFDVVIIGGGIIGGSCAFQLSKAGLKVAILEKKTVGSGASGCSAAMLEYQTDSHRGEPFISLAKASNRQFPTLYEEIKNLTGIDFQYERCGILQIATNPEDQILLENETIRQSHQGAKADWLSAEELATQYPELDNPQYGGAFFHEDGQVNGEKFTAAMIKAAQLKGTQIFEHVNIQRIETRAGRVHSIMTSTGEFQADHFILAAGAWTDQVLGLIDEKLGIEPLKGQLCVYDSPPSHIQHPIYTKNMGYIVPKKDGYTLAGSTVERVGFDESTTTSAKETLSSQAHKILPSLTHFRFRGMTAGLRPGSPDDLPFLGPLKNVENFIMATGHFRNGILLAPITSLIISEFIINGTVPKGAHFFLPDRLLAHYP
jgi:glycine oxidase